ncbi:hypothetical protein DPX16_14211 [Anabarilius grahami]|uniref:Uncharacterized protein n=1 Tax=Anabarilius grahami TaxID=495550 RepID=A0A3N0XHV6_ANAGA|nr:hypothetical protein DPX16_14211 [Anabarilius grahami]
MDVPEPDMRMENDITLDPETHRESDQVHEPAAPCVTEGVLVEFEGWDESPTHNPTAVDVISMDSGKYIKDVFEEVIPLFLPSLLVPPSPEFSVSPLVPSSPDSPVTPLVPPSPMSSVNPPSLPLPHPSSVPPLRESDQVHEPAAPCVTEGVLVEFEGWDESPTHNPTAVDVISMDSGKYIKDVFEEVIPLFLPSLLVPPSPEFSVSPLVLSSPDSPVTPLVPPSPMSSVNPPSLPLPHPSSPTSFLSPTSAGSLQPLCISYNIH